MTSRYEALDLLRQGVYSIDQLKQLAKDAKGWYFYRWSKLVYSFSKRIHNLTNYPKDNWNTVNTLKEWI